MSATYAHDHERLLELLADQALDDLNLSESQELLALLNRYPDEDTESMDRTAATIYATYVPRADDAMPTELISRIERQGRMHVRRTHHQPHRIRSGTAPTAAPSRTDDRTQQIGPTPPPPIAGRITWAPWLVAAAAIALAAVIWTTQSQPTQLPPDRALAQFTQQNPPADLVRSDWQVLDDPSVDADATSGQVIWSDRAQRGYMVFNNLAANDPTDQQYQLWIFDADGDERYPIDGGVFDISTDGRAVVEINPKIEVSEATMFAITVEKPGGVVVSDRSRLPLLAKVNQSS